MKKNSIILTPALTELGFCSVSRADALEELSGRLAQLGYVNNEYCRQVVQREEECPTGLAFNSIAVAIPHADPINVHQSACVIARCKEPIPFGNMEAPAKMLPVEIIFMLALNNPNDHLELISQLMTLFSDEEQVTAIRRAETKEELCRLFTAYLL